jgi:hypothetical protein
MARAKRVSKQFGTKTPTRTTRGMPSTGKRTVAQRTRAIAQPDKRVRTLTSENAKYVGRPQPYGTKIPGVVDGKQKVRRVMQRDPARGTSLPQADKITSAGIDLVGNQRPKILMQPLPNTQGSRYDNARKSVPAPRKSKVQRTNKPGRVTRSPGS